MSDVLFTNVRIFDGGGEAPFTGDVLVQGNRISRVLKTGYGQRSAPVLGATSAFLWTAHTLALPAQAAGVAGIVALLWGVGVLTQPGISRAGRALADGAGLGTAGQNRT